jgi:hypothetical protein
VSKNSRETSSPGAPISRKVICQVFSGAAQATPVACSQSAVTMASAVKPEAMPVPSELPSIHTP